MRKTFLLLGSVLLVACGGSTSDTSGGGDDTGTNDDAFSDGVVTDSSLDSTTDGVSTDTAGDTSVPPDVDAAPPVCSSEPTRVACQDCCVAEHKDGAKTFEAALVACACADGICKTTCATTACASPPTKPNDACRACLQSSVTPPGDAGADASTDAAGPEGKCYSSVSSACSTDSRCVAYVTCLGTCP